ncbi:nuclear transport factor 2 family protein [Frateuria aurantia]
MDKMVESETGRSNMEELLIRDAIESLLNRYAQAFDDRSFDMTLGALFTNDCLVDLPPGVHRGITGLEQFHAAVMAPFERTQHVFTNYIIGLNGDKATFRANAHVTHLITCGDNPEVSELFLVGGVLTGSAVMLSNRWRISTVTLVPIWRNGEGPGPDMKVG